MSHLNKMQSCFFQYVKKLYGYEHKLLHTYKKVTATFTNFFSTVFISNSKGRWLQFSNLLDIKPFGFEVENAHLHSTYSNDLETGRSVMIFWVVWPSIILLGMFEEKRFKIYVCHLLCDAKNFHEKKYD